MCRACARPLTASPARAVRIEAVNEAGRDRRHRASGRRRGRAFERRMRAREEAELSPLAVRSYPGAAGARRSRLRPAHPVSARPRPDRPLQGVPAAQAQDAGVRGPERRPLPHPADPHARGHPGLAHGRPCAGAQRGSGRGDRPRPRPRSPAVRPRRRGGAGPLPARALRGALPAPRALAARGRHARARRPGPEPDRTGARRDRQPLRPRAAAGDAGGQDRAAGRPGRLHQPRHRRRRARRACSRRPTCPPKPIEILGDTGPRRIDTLVHDLVEHSDAAGDIVQGETSAGR